MVKHGKFVEALLGTCYCWRLADHVLYIRYLYVDFIDLFGTVIIIQSIVTISYVVVLISLCIRKAVMIHNPVRIPACAVPSFMI
jgi:hypothetical protein